MMHEHTPPLSDRHPLAQAIADEAMNALIPKIEAPLIRQFGPDWAREYPTIEEAFNAELQRVADTIYRLTAESLGVGATKH